MWFAMHVKPGCERQVVELMRSTPKSGLLDEVFCPMAECWSDGADALRPMFEGTVFVVAPGRREVRACTRLAGGLEAMYAARPALEPLEDDEAAFVDLWAAPDGRVCPMSEGRLDGSGSLQLERGPLYERQGAIAGFSGSRRWAFLDTSVAGKPTRAMAGVRITKDGRQHGGKR